MIRMLWTLVATVTTLGAMRQLTHMLQLESYQLPGYGQTLRRNTARLLWPGIVLALFNLLCVGGCLSYTNRLLLQSDGTLSPAVESAWLVGASLLCMAAGVGMHCLFFRLPAKKPLVFTPRVKRLYGVLMVVTLLLAVWLVYGVRLLPIALLLPVAAPLLLPLAALLITPVERAINHHYFRDAQRKLAAQSHTIRIGITGSYGKTSVKFMLQTLLSEKYHTLCTPGSFNTPMGVTRVIREQLESTHEVFIVEMGARHVGEIAELCRLVHPQFGILTSVGPQHLQTFHTQENITRTKYELIEALPPEGAAVFPADGGICEQLYEKTAIEKHLTGDRAAGLGMMARDVQTGSWGSRFTLVAANGETVSCETQLLGEHNIQNLLLCCTLAARLGLTLGQIAQGMAKMKPVEHRLQLVPTNHGVTVIDDAFNSNPAGAKAALLVLAQFPKRRILVTPGMVELGEEEHTLNRIFGEQAAQSADMVILIGKHHTEPIAEGLRTAGFDEKMLYVVDSLDESTARLSEMLQAGDTVLYENDLPDHYQG